MFKKKDDNAEILKEIQMLNKGFEGLCKEVDILKSGKQPESIQIEIPQVEIPKELRKDTFQHDKPTISIMKDDYKHPDFVHIPNFEIPTVDDGKVKFAKKHAGLGFWKKMKLNRNPLTSYLITMIYPNGTVEHFVLETNSNFFKHGKKRQYHLNKTKCLWDSNEKQNRLYYHFDCVEPLEFLEIKSEVGLNEAYASITPQNLEPVIKMEFVRLIAEGPELSRMVKIVLFLCIAILGLLLIIVIVLVAQSGIFQQMASGLKGVAGGAV